jgi:hypothetical protein
VKGGRGWSCADVQVMNPDSGIVLWGLVKSRQHKDVHKDIAKDADKGSFEQFNGAAQRERIIECWTHQTYELLAQSIRTA